MTFDLYDILIGQGRRFNSNWYDVSTTYNKKVVSVFQEPMKLSGAITARKRPCTLLIWKIEEASK